MTQLTRRLFKLYNLLSSQTEPPAPITPAAGWGTLPQVSLLMAIGITFISASNILARNGNDQAMLVYWIGLAFMVIPVAMRFVFAEISSAEAIGMLLIFAVVNFISVHMSSPQILRGFDEALHWRTAVDILYNRQLFTPNSMLPVSPLYPGLENATTALVNLSGLTIYEAASTLLMVARVIMLLSLYYLYLEISGSVRVAGLATLVYIGSSTFMYFDAQFGYESLALPLVLICLYMLAHRTRLPGSSQWIWNLLLALIMFAIVATHHMTTYALAGILILWVCIDIGTILFKGQPSAPPWAAFLLVGMIWVWVGLISTNTIGYLTPILNGAANSFYSLLARQSAPRQLFQDLSGESGALLFERIVAILAVLIWGLRCHWVCWNGGGVTRNWPLRPH